MEVKGIVTNINKYGESGAYVEILTSEKTFIFFIKNFFYANKKNILLNSTLARSYFIIDDKTGVLNDFFIIDDSFRFVENIKKMFFVILIKEMIHKIFLNDEKNKIFTVIYKVLDILDKINNSDEIVSLIAIFIGISLRLIGIGLKVDRCVITGEKNNIIAVSFFDGGVVSEKAFNKKKHKFYSKTKLDIIRKIFKAQESDLGKLIFQRFETIEIISDLFNYLYLQMGIKLKNQELILKML